MGLLKGEVVRRLDAPHGNCGCGKMAYRRKDGTGVCRRCDALEEAGLADPPLCCGVSRHQEESMGNAEMREINRWLESEEGQAILRGTRPATRRGRPTTLFGRGERTPFRETIYE